VTEPVVIEVRRIDYGDPRAAGIREAMDVEMTARYAGVNRGWTNDELDDMLAKIDAALAIHPEQMVATVGAFDGERIVGHAALRPVEVDGEDALEVKRVIVLPEYRGLGISKRLMAQLEIIASERGVRRLLLQTGDQQPEAVSLYETIGYEPIPRFGLYEPVPFFLCYAKVLEA
jgi:GNAT superfamily N-acetyltransferase